MLSNPQIAMFDAVVRAIGRRQEPGEVNPLAGIAGNLDDEAFREATARIYGAGAGAYGAGVSALIETGAWSARDDLGTAISRLQPAPTERGSTAGPTRTGFPIA